MNFILNILSLIAAISLAQHRQKNTENYIQQEPRPLTDREFNLLASDVCNQLTSNGPFKRQVMIAVIMSIITFAGLLAGLIGYSFISSIQSQLNNLQLQSTKEISKAKREVEIEISDKLRTEKITQIIEKSASNQAQSIIDKSLNPSLAEFKNKIDASTIDLNLKISETSKTADENLKKLDIELKILTNRNKITALADTAITNGSLASYLTLEKMCDHNAETVTKNAAFSELFRVYQAYSIFAPYRLSGINITPEAFNPFKNTESDITIEEIMARWNDIPDPLSRAKVAELMREKIKVGSYKTAKFLMSSIEKETHLECLRQLGENFKKTTNIDIGTKLDLRELKEWWKDHESDFKKKNTDI